MHGESRVLGFNKHVLCGGVLVVAAGTRRLQNQFDLVIEAILVKSMNQKVEVLHLHVTYVGILPYHTHTHRRTHTPTDYCNPRPCALAGRGLITDVLTWCIFLDCKSPYEFLSRKPVVMLCLTQTETIV